ncbi:pumilio homolog 3-like isoform X2 [Corticium candelabrum]|uniref:pumilio homolog 3-like isoform X2 n=1 Tax=Corticium candelabrum TaxID=121492 RepID=UPI002E255A0D|nr:pumilio homolog 3-like isoform X2 [Corticium candelabrum]
MVSHVAKSNSGQKAKKWKSSLKGKKKLKRKQKTQKFTSGKKKKASDVAEKENKSATESQRPQKRKKFEGIGNVTSSEKGGGAAGRAKRVKTEKSFVAMTRKERREVRRKSKGNYELVKDVLSTWESLRRHDLNRNDREELVARLCTLLGGRMKEVIFKHDLGRVVQSCLKFGNEEQRAAICAELRDDIVRLCKSKYSKFTVKKIIKYSTKSQRDQVIASLYGKVRHLIRHSDAADIVEYAYNEYANAEQRSALVEEFYGPQFALFKSSGVRRLQDMFDSDASLKPSVVKYLHEALTPLLDKNAVKHSIVHRAMLDFFLHADPTTRSEMIESMHNAVVQVLHTKDGSRVAMNCIWHGTAKDRKAIVKTFRSFVKKICMEEHGHLVILAIFDNMDDTVLVKKTVISEIAACVDDLVKDVVGRKVLHYLLCPRDRRFFHPDVIGILQRGDSNAHSKKEASVRWSELRDGISPSLVSYVAANAKDLLYDKPGSLLLQSIMDHSAGDLHTAMEAVATVVTEPFDPQTHVVCDPCGHFALKKLIQNDTNRQGPPFFSEIMLSKVQGNDITEWVSTNRGAFVVASLLECPIKSSHTTVKKWLTRSKTKLKRLDSPGGVIVNELITKKP